MVGSRNLSQSSNKTSAKFDRLPEESRDRMRFEAAREIWVDGEKKDTFALSVKNYPARPQVH